MHALEAIRRRPGMYVGDIHDGSGLVHMLWEVVANALDEHLAGHCDRIAIEVAEDGAISVEDNGRGIRLDAVDGVSFAEKALTSFHTGPTLDGHAPHEHIGTRGVGLFAVCALSAWLELQVSRDGRCWRQRFERGLAVSTLHAIGSTATTGTRIVFAPDPEIFAGSGLNPGPVLARIEEMSYLFPRLTLAFEDRRRHQFHNPDGLASYVRASGTFCGEELPAAMFLFASSAESIFVEVAATWYASPRTSLASFANAMRTTDGGTHVEGLLRGLVSGLRIALPEVCRGRRREDIERVLESGLNAVVCVRLADPEYGRPTKDRLSSPRATAVIERCLAAPFASYLHSEPTLLARISAGLRGDTD
jgi:DNA gyrase subunit B